MLAEHLNPFATALVKTFRTMLSCEIQRGPLELRKPGLTEYEVSGVIGLSGAANGTTVLCLSKEVALRAASALLLCKTDQLDRDVIDAVGELTNMVGGAAKAQLAELHLSLGLPSVILGTDFNVRYPSHIRPIDIPYTCAWGKLALQVGFGPITVA